MSIGLFQSFMTTLYILSLSIHMMIYFMMCLFNFEDLGSRSSATVLYYGLILYMRSADEQRRRQE